MPTHELRTRWYYSIASESAREYRGERTSSPLYRVRGEHPKGATAMHYPLPTAYQTRPLVYAIDRGERLQCAVWDYLRQPSDAALQNVIKLLRLIDSSTATVASAAHSDASADQRTALTVYRVVLDMALQVIRAPASPVDPPQTLPAFMRAFAFDTVTSLRRLLDAWAVSDAAPYRVSV